jgi:HEAT repeat protein
LVADKDGHVAQEAILALANIGPGAKEAEPALTAALEQGEKSNAFAVAYALGKIGPDAAGAEPALFGLLDDSDRQLALVSAWALTHIDPASTKVAEKAIPVLIAGLKGRTPLARSGAAEALGSLGAAAKAAIPALESARNDKDPSVRAAVAKALSLIGGNPVPEK